MNLKGLKLGLYKILNPKGVYRFVFIDETGDFQEMFMPKKKINNDGTVDFKNETYYFTSEDVKKIDGIPTIFFYIDNPRGFAGKQLKKPNKHPNMNSRELNSIVHNNIVKDIIKAEKGGEPDKIVLILGAVAVGGLALGGFFIYELMEMVTEQAEQIEEMRMYILEEYGSNGGEFE